MMKWIKALAWTTVLFMECLFARNGLLFNVAATGEPANVHITLCLNGKGPLSCQNYNVSALNLSITTTIPNHTYPIVGIKINTPGYTLANIGLNCTVTSNGYCLFSANNTQPTSIFINKTSGYSISGSISNLMTSGLVLQNNGNDNLIVSSGATSFQFAKTIPFGASYNVTVFNQPTELTCAVNNASGTHVITDINNIAISCALNVAAYVTNTNSNSVSRCPINSNGSFGSCIDLGNPGNTFSGLRGIIINQTKSLAYVANATTSTISKCPITINGTFATCTDSGVGSVFSGPRTLVLNNTNSIVYVTNFINNTVSKCAINSDGTFSTCVNAGNTGITFNQPVGITLNSVENTMYVVNSGNNTVSKCPINSNGTLGACADSGNTGVPFNSPSGIALNREGNTIYIANNGNNTVSKCPINLDGTFGACSDSGNTGVAFNSPQPITLNTAGNIAYIANVGNSTVSECPINTNGTFAACVESGNTGIAFSAPRGIALG